jgi:5-methylcytosine-specific restriction endonuclease McrA
MECVESTPTMVQEQSKCKACNESFVPLSRIGRPALYCEKHMTGRRRRKNIRLKRWFCAVCQIGIVRPRSGPMPRYCSRTCRTAAASVRAVRSGQRQSSPKNGLVATSECRICFQGFTTRSGWKSSYCSNECRTLARCVQHECVICGDPYFCIPAKTAAKFSKTCSGRCRREYQQRNATVETFRCKFCDLVFSAPKQSNRMFCGKQCVDAYWKRNRNLIYNASRRLDELGKPTGAVVVNPVEVFKRDNWTCWLCNLSIDRFLKWPDPMSASVDHVIPISKGGEHSMSNVRSAHLRCNCRKSDSLKSVARSS